MCREMGLRDGQRDLHTIHASIMLPAKCHKATVICLLSLHTFRTTHTHTHTVPAAAIVGACERACVCVCLLGLLSPMSSSSSLRILCNQQTFGHRIPQTGIQHTQLSANFPLSTSLSPISPALLPSSPFRFRPSTHPCLSCLLLLLLISATFTWLT